MEYLIKDSTLELVKGDYAIFGLESAWTNFNMEFT